MELGPEFKFVKRVDALSMDPAEVKAVEFAFDPWKYMQYFLQEKRNEMGDNTASVANVVIDELTSLLQASIDDNLQINNVQLYEYMNAQEIYDRQRALFGFLKDVGVSKTELMSWTQIESVEDDPKFKLAERAEKLILDEVYGEDQ